MNASEVSVTTAAELLTSEGQNDLSEAVEYDKQA